MLDLDELAKDIEDRVGVGLNLSRINGEVILSTIPDESLNTDGVANDIERALEDLGASSIVKIRPETQEGNDCLFVQAILRDEEFKHVVNYEAVPTTMSDQSLVEKMMGQDPDRQQKLDEAATRDKVNELIGCCTTDAGKLDRGKLRSALGVCSSGVLNKMLNAATCGDGGEKKDAPKAPKKKDDDGKQDAAVEHGRAKADLYDDPPKYGED